MAASIAAVITEVAFDLDGNLLDHEQAARDAVLDWVAARGWQAPEDAAAQWLRLEREHFAAFTTGAITFEEQRRRRLRALDADRETNRTPPWNSGAASSDRWSWPRWHWQTPTPKPPTPARAQARLATQPDRGSRH